MTLCHPYGKLAVIMDNERQPVTDGNPTSAVQRADRAPAGAVYAIRVKGHLGSRWSEWFSGLTITVEPDGETLLSGRIVDQAALYSLLDRVQRLGLELLAVNRIEPPAGSDMT